MMMTLGELERTADDWRGRANDPQTTQESQRVRTALHSTQSITGRQSLLTKDHVQHLSASDALSAYISDFEDSHPLQTSLYQRTVEDLLLPRSILERTVDRSLETGKRDTREEYHLHDVRRMIDESFEEIMHSENERRKELNEAITQSFERSILAPSEPTSLPGRNLSTLSRLTPILKSTPVKPGRKSPRSYQYQASLSKRRAARDGKTNLRANTATAPSLNVTSGPTRATNSYHLRYPDGRSAKHELDLTTTKVGHHHTHETSDISLGGRAPPTWVEELDHSSMTLTSVDRESLEDGPPLRGVHFHDGTLSHDGVSSETDLLGEVEKPFQTRRGEHRRKQHEAVAMKERWLQDRRNESRSLKPPRHRSTGMERTESVTTEDLVNASPYGLDRRKSALVSGRSSRGRLYSVGENIPQRYSYSGKFSRNSRDILSKSDDSIDHRRRLRRWREPPPSATQGTSKSAPAIGNLSRRDSLGILRDWDHMSAEPQLSRGMHLLYPSSSTNTESLVHASPLEHEAVSTFASREGNSSGYPSIGQTSLHQTIEQDASEYASIGESHTLGSIGETSRVEAVLGRAHRLMDAAKDDLNIGQTRTRPASPGSGSDGFMDRYHDDCNGTSQQEPAVCRPLESLKKILFTLQDIEGSQTTEVSSNSEISGRDGYPGDTDVDVGLPPVAGVAPGSESIERAMVHLSRLKNLINEEEHQ